MSDARQGRLATHEFLRLPPLPIGDDQIHRAGQAGHEFGGQFRGKRAGIKQQRSSALFHQTLSGQAIFLATVDPDFAVGQHLGGQPRRVTWQDLLGRMHQNDHPRLQGDLGNVLAKAERFTDFAAGATMWRQQSPRATSPRARNDPVPIDVQRIDRRCGRLMLHQVNFVDRWSNIKAGRVATQESPSPIPNREPETAGCDQCSGAGTCRAFNRRCPMAVSGRWPAPIICYRSVALIEPCRRIPRWNPAGRRNTLAD